MSSQTPTEKQFNTDVQVVQDVIVHCGSLPPRLMRERLFGEGA
jgi:hypothetical protein